MLTAGLVQMLVEYDPVTGLFRWRHRPSHFFSTDSHYRGWNNKFEGQLALACVHSKGYRFGEILGSKVFAHRAAFAIRHGEWPSGLIDHRNRNKADNRWDNLRIATDSQNQANTGPQKNSLVGLKGVTFDKQTGRWRASIQIDGTRRCLGRHDTKELAKAAYDTAARNHFKEFANG